MQMKPYQIQLLGIALIILGGILRFGVYVEIVSLIVGIGAPWLGLVLVVAGCFMREPKRPA